MKDNGDHTNLCVLTLESRLECAFREDRDNLICLKSEMSGAFLMCCEEEALERQRHDDIHPLESTIDTAMLPSSKRVFDSGMVVRKFIRSGAGADLHSKPHRTVDQLQVTVDYLIRVVWKADGCSDLMRHIREFTIATRYGFVMDRLQAVRQEIVSRNITSEGITHLLEKCVLYYVVSLYECTIFCSTGASQNQSTPSSVAWFDRHLHESAISSSISTLLQFSKLLCKQQPTFYNRIETERLTLSLTAMSILQRTQRGLTASFEACSFSSVSTPDLAIDLRQVNIPDSQQSHSTSAESTPPPHPPPPTHPTLNSAGCHLSFALAVAKNVRSGNPQRAVVEAVLYHLHHNSTLLSSEEGSDRDYRTCDAVLSFFFMLLPELRAFRLLLLEKAAGKCETIPRELFKQKLWMSSDDAVSRLCTTLNLLVPQSPSLTPPPSSSSSASASSITTTTTTTLDYDVKNSILIKPSPPLQISTISKSLMTLNERIMWLDYSTDYTPSLTKVCSEISESWEDYKLAAKENDFFSNSLIEMKKVVQRRGPKRSQ